MGTGQRNMLGNGRKQFPKHPYPEGGIAGHYIFNLVGILVELQADVAYGVIVIAQFNPFLQSVDESGPQRILIGGA